MPINESRLGPALDDWLIQLDHEEFQVGVRERVLVQTLLAHLSASGELPEHKSLEDILQMAGPLLCTQPEQQRKYATLLTEFAARQTMAIGQIGQDRQGKPNANLKKPGKIRFWHIIFAALFLGSLSFGIWWLMKPPPPHPVDTSDIIAKPEEPYPSDPAPLDPIYVPVSNLPLAISSSSSQWAAPVRIGLLACGGIALLGVVGLAWSYWRRQLYLQNTRTDKEVKEHLLTDPNPVKIEPPPAIIRRASQIMRQQYAGEREMVDVSATLRATMSACGAISPCYRPIKQTPEYLVLVDRRHQADHHAVLSEVFIAALRRNGVHVEVQYFEGSPETGCWRLHATPEGLEPFRVTSFPDVAGRFTGHRLLMFADIHALVDEIDGSPRRWAKHLKAFQQRAWFTPMPVASWGKSEQTADAQGFLVLPLQPESLNTMASWFSAGQLGLEIGPDWPHSFPSLLRGEEVAWVVRQIPPSPEVQEDLLFQLRNYLGAQRFQWLCACAIFPAISPAITLALGRELATDARQLTLGMAAIGALPWFRHAFMPAWLRLALLNRLEESNELRFRQIIEERLVMALEDVSGSPLLTLTERKRRLRAWFRRRSGLARDVVLVGFLEQGPLSRLAQRLPEGLRKRLFRNGLPVYGLATGVLWILPVGLLLGLLGLPGIWERIPPHTPEQKPIDELVLDGQVGPGDSGVRVKRVQEWLAIHGYNVFVDGVYGHSTARAVEQFRMKKGLEQSSVVDDDTYNFLVEPMQHALKPVETKGKTFSQLVAEIAENHLEQHPIEVGGINRGPWVRLYMQGREGEAWAWTGGFVSFVIRQAAKAIDIDPPISSFSVDALAAQAKQKGIFIDEESGRRPKPGDIMLIRRTATDWIHCGVVIEVNEDSFVSIEGNTNDEGRREGYEVAMRARTFKGKDFISLSEMGGSDRF